MTIPGNATALLLPSTNTQYKVERSLRFNSSDSAYLSRTPASAGNRRTWTFSAWVKRAELGTNQFLFAVSAENSDAGVSQLFFDTSNAIRYGIFSGEPFITSAVFRDTAAWYHIVFIYDTANATAADRYILYVNGVRQATSTYTAPTQNFEGGWNRTAEHAIGRRQGVNDRYFNGYLADVHFIDGQALTPSSFTEVSATTGQLIPKKYTGTFTGNSFWLQFADNSAATATTLGKDSSGLGNNWTPNNFAVNSGPVYSLYTTASPGFSGSYPVTRMFDGNTATEAITSNASGVGSITFTPNTAISYASSVEVYNATGAAITATLNGGSPVTLSTTTGWNTVVSGSGSITSLVLSRSNGAVAVSAIRINGTTILTDGAGAGNDSLVDTPTSYGTDDSLGGSVRGNYATLNPLFKASSATLANGNLDWSTTSSYALCSATIGLPTSGKWYWEVTPTATPISSGIFQYTGVIEEGTKNTDYIEQFGVSNAYAPDGKIYYSGGSSTYGNTWTTNDVIGVAVDMDNGAIYYSKNGTWQNSGVPTSGASKTGAARTNLSGKVLFPAIATNAGITTSASFNFGQRQWAYAAPAGFRPLVDTCLPAPVVAKASSAFDAITWTGNGSSQSITLPGGFSPDLVWLKQRNGTEWHGLFNTIVGATTRLFSNSTNAEATNAQTLTAFNSNGFSVGNTNEVNGSGNSYVAWCWDAGTTTSSNVAGSITSSVRANPSAGFSVVTYTGTGTTASVGHGLGIAPSLIICKQRNGTAGWVVYHKSTGRNGYLILNATDAFASLAGYWGTSDPSATVINFDAGGYGGNNGNGSTYVAYCFAPVSGYSSFGSYTGNGSTDGPFVYTGFRPRWVMFKRTDSTSNWVINDAARPTYNASNEVLYPNLPDQTNAGLSDAFYRIDILSNGFKIRNTGGDHNISGGTFIYAAFAENPFQYARAR